MEPLDKTLGLDGLTVTVTKEAPKPLGDLALNLELSNHAIADSECDSYTKGLPALVSDLHLLQVIA